MVPVAAALAGPGQAAAPTAAASAGAAPGLVAGEASAAAPIELPPLDGADAFASAETGPAEAADLSAEATEEADVAVPDAAAGFPEQETTAETTAEATTETPANATQTPVLPPQASAQAQSAAHATLVQGLAALRRPETAEAPPRPAPFALTDDLHYRLIQYARFTVPLVAAQPERFGLVYAADWPTWLAALELRYRCHCPLVLHVAALALDEAAPAERGWLLELERYALRRAHTVLVPSEALRQRVLAGYPALLPDRVVVCNVADAEALAAALATVVPGG